MVATRRSARTAPEVEPPATTSTLKAPPKRAGKRKAVEDAPAEPARKTAKTTKAEAKAKAVKKPAAKTASKTAVVKTTAAKTAVAKTTRRSAKTVETIEEEPEPTAEVEAIEEPKTKRTVRVRKPAAPVAEVAQRIELPASVEELTTTEPVAEPAKRAVRARKAPAKQPAVKAKAPSKVVPKPTLDAPAAAPMIARATRGRKIAEPAVSPLKAPARKPVRKARATAKTEAVVASTEEPVAKFSSHPDTPAPVAAPLSSPKVLESLPPTNLNTPAHVPAPISNEEALAELAGYPETPAHIITAFANQKALEELPAEYPKTPAQFVEAYNNQKALDELPAEYPKTPAHIVEAYHNQKALGELPEGYPKTPAHIAATYSNQKALNELPEEYPRTPAHIAAAFANQQALDELPDYPQTPAHVQAAWMNQKALNELPEEYPKTPAHAVATVSNLQAFDQMPEYPKTPAHIASAYANQKALDTLPVEYPSTPAHITAPLASREALQELPTDYPRTPAHIKAPLSNVEGLAVLPSYLATPVATESAMQEVIAQQASSTPVEESGGRESSVAATALASPTPVESEQLDLSTLDSDEDFSEADVGSVAPGFQTIGTLTNNVTLAPSQIPSFAVPPPPSPSKRSALKSPAKTEMKTPKKTVTWNDDSENDFVLFDGPLNGMLFFVDVTSNGKDQSFLFTTLLEDLGAQVLREWNQHTYLTHVLFKDGKKSTLDKVAASNGKVKCVNVGWVLDSEKNKKRVDEAPYLVDLASTKALSPPKPKTTPFTPAKTPSRLGFGFSLQDRSNSPVRSVPTTPTSSEFDRSINFDEKENSELGIFFTEQAKSVPKPQKSWLLTKTPMKTPSKPDFLKQTPLRAFSTTKKRSVTESFGGISMKPAKKLRLFD